MIPDDTTSSLRDQLGFTVERGEGRAVVTIDFDGEPRVQLAQRLWVLRDERADAAGLRAREVLRHDPPGGEPNRVLVVDVLCWRSVPHGVEPARLSSV